MTTVKRSKLTAIFLLGLLAAVAAEAQTFTTLYNFNGTQGYHPVSLVQGRDGNFYGTTIYGGTSDNGAIFKITPSGEVTDLYSFSAPSYPNGLILASDGNFYGTTYYGGSGGYCSGEGCGTVFTISPDGGFGTIYSFCSQPNCADGSLPAAGLIQAPDGQLYGTTSQGNSPGTVFKITTAGALTTLYTFCSIRPSCSDGSVPRAALIQASDGNFYGTTNQGGTSSCECGTAFRITPGGKLTTLYAFCGQSPCSDGASPMAPLVQTSQGSLVGTTELGGTVTCNCGTIFEILPSGMEKTIHNFGAGTGQLPIAGLIQGTDLNLYGTTSSGGAGCVGHTCAGTIYQLTPDKMTTVHAFDYSDGEGPNWLIQSTNGIFYGTAGNAGEWQGGTVFSLDMGLIPFVAFVIPAGEVGQTGGILGQGFTGTTSVEINGVPAAFKVVSDTYLTATVPPGATTGYVTVTTPTGVLTSNVPFRVIP